MIKVCWLSSCIFSDEPIRATGTWLKPLADGLVRSGEVELYNITRDFSAHTERQTTASGIRQWILPNYRYGQGLLLDHEPRQVCQRIRAILDEIRPDVVHIWGTEFKWTSVYTQGYIPYPTFIDMQGVLSYYAPAYYADLMGKERQAVAWSWSDLKHWRKSHLYKHWEMERRSRVEQEHLPLFPFISVQSRYMEQCIHSLAPQSQQLHTGIILRPEFHKAAGSWRPVSHPVIFACAGTFCLPYKGLHVLLRALGQLINQYPDIELHIGGERLDLQHPTDGYTRHLAQLVHQLGIDAHLRWLGPLDAQGIISEMLQSQLCVVPSFIETYCLSMAEAMMVGLPCIAARAAALPELATDGEEALYYEPSDAENLARHMEHLLSDAALAQKLSRGATQRRLAANVPDRIIQQQIANYHRVIDEWPARK